MTYSNLISGSTPIYAKANARTSKIKNIQNQEDHSAPYGRKHGS